MIKWKSGSFLKMSKSFCTLLNSSLDHIQIEIRLLKVMLSKKHPDKLLETLLNQFILCVTTVVKQILREWEIAIPIFIWQLGRFFSQIE